MSIIMLYYTVHVSADAYVETFHGKLYNACIYIFTFDNTHDIGMHYMYGKYVPATCCVRLATHQVVGDPALRLTSCAVHATRWIPFASCSFGGVLTFIRSRHLPFLESTRQRNAIIGASGTYLSAVAKSVWQLLSGEGFAQY
jgi:hypothetical protein